MHLSYLVFVSCKWEHSCILQESIGSVMFKDPILSMNSEQTYCFVEMHEQRSYCCCLAGMGQVLQEDARAVSPWETRWRCRLPQWAHHKRPASHPWCAHLHVTTSQPEHLQFLCHPAGVCVCACVRVGKHISNCISHVEHWIFPLGGSYPKTKSYSPI